jgi:hypothetical protein
MADRPYVAPAAALVLILVPLVVCSTIYLVAVEVLGLAARGWLFVTFVLAGTYYVVMWLGLRKVGAVVGRYDLSGSQPESRGLSAGSKLIRYSGGLLVIGFGCWLLVRGDQRAWIFLGAGFLAVALRWMWTHRRSPRQLTPPSRTS